MSTILFLTKPLQKSLFLFFSPKEIDDLIQTFHIFHNIFLPGLSFLENVVFSCRNFCERSRANVDCNGSDDSTFMYTIGIVFDIDLTLVVELSRSFVQHIRMMIRS